MVLTRISARASDGVSRSKEGFPARLRRRTVRYKETQGLALDRDQEAVAEIVVRQNIGLKPCHSSNFPQTFLLLTIGLGSDKLVAVWEVHAHEHVVAT